MLPDTSNDVSVSITPNLKVLKPSCRLLPYANRAERTYTVIIMLCNHTSNYNGVLVKVVGCGGFCYQHLSFSASLSLV